MILAELEIDGRARKVLMQAPKNGFFYVLDRTTGELLSAEKYVPVNWASHVDPASGRPVETEGARYPAGQPFMVQPSQLGGHNWQPMAWSPNTGLVYIPAQENTGFMMKEPDFRFEPDRWNTGVLNPPMPPDPSLLAQAKASMRGHLLAWDPVRRTAAWRTQHNSSWNGGVLATAGGLVFQGVGGEGLPPSTRGMDVACGSRIPGSTFSAGRSATCSMANSTSPQPPASEAPSISPRVPCCRAPAHRYRAASSSGNWTGGRQCPRPKAGRTSPPADEGTEGQLQQGGALYARYCMQCHGARAMAGGGMPDLRHSPYLTDAALFRRPLIDGVLAARGMPDFGKTLQPAQADAIRAYVIRMAHAMRAGTASR
ncbi:c-type cytochrome [Thauera humireducens]|uniref:c-type cytochrome n=1 Tax=Thauera humireducens TaxID=1134435 RepID=UPI00311DD161